MSRREQQRLVRRAGADAPVSRRTTASRGVNPAGSHIRHEDDPPYGEALPYAFDLTSIIAAPVSGTTSLLIGPGALEELQRIPPRTRAYIDGIAPYLEDGVGPVLSPRIPGAGVTITWSILLDNKPAAYYGAITTLLDDWSYVSPRPLLEIPEGQIVTVTVTNVDPAGLYDQLGIRIRGRWVPVKRERGRK